MQKSHLKRYAQIAGLLARHGRSDLVRDARIDQLLDEPVGAPADGGAGARGGEAEATADAEALAAELERLGPTFIKLGQLLSTRVDLLPTPYLVALTKLQDRVEPFTYEQVERIVQTELGVRISKAFQHFETEPIAAASLAQVHRATLRDGRLVAVKVQRPGIREQVVDDLDVLGQLAEKLDRHTDAGRRYRFSQLHDQFRRALLRELDFRNEARNLVTLAENLDGMSAIVVPQPVDDYTTSRVLTMEFIRGRKITAISPVALIELDRERLADELFRAYLRQILVDGFFHADPHPGNVFVTEDGRIALLDLGMVARLAPETRDELTKLVMAVGEGRGEDAADLALSLSEKDEDADEAGFRRRVTDLVVAAQGTRAEEIALGTLVLHLVRSAAEHGVHAPPELSLLGKTLFNLDQVGRALDPELDPNAAIRRHAAEIMQRSVRRGLSPSSLFATFIELNDFVRRLPSRMNRLLDILADNELAVKVETFDERRLMAGLQKIANRITLGLVIAALILAAAMLVRVETSATILGYPALAFVFFLAAALAGIFLIVSILRSDV